MSTIRHFLSRLTRRQRDPHAAVRAHYDAFQDRALTGAADEAYRNHLDGCPACRNWVARQNTLARRLRAERPPAQQLSTTAAAQTQQHMYRRIKRSIMMQQLKLSLQTVLTAVAVILLAGAALWWQFGRADQTGSPDATPPAPAATNESTTADDPAVVTFAVPPVGQSEYELIAALFNRLNDDITVQVVPLTDGSADAAHIPASPTVPDAYLDLSNLLAETSMINPDDYVAGALQGCQAGDHSYGLPFNITPSYIYYDRTLLDELGVPVPDANWRWPDLVAAITVLSSGDGERVGFAGVDGLLRLLQPVIAAGLNADGSLDPAVLQPYLDDIAGLIAAGHVVDVSRTELETMILFGQVGFWLDNPAALSPVLQQQEETLGILPAPRLEERTAVNPAALTCLVINENSAQPEAAWRWLQYLALNPPAPPPGSFPANRLLVDAAALPPGSPAALAVEQTWFSSRQAQVTALLPALRQHLVAGVPLADALAGAGETAAAAPTPTTAPPAAAPDPITITYFGDQFRLQEAVETFQRSNPHITVDIIPLPPTGPDGTFTMEMVADYFDCFSWTVGGQAPPDLPELVVDLAALADPETVADIDPALLAPLQQHGALLGLPLQVNPVLIRYDAAQFAAAGVPLPTADWTLAEMLEIAARFGDTGDPPAYGFVSTVSLLFSGPELMELLLRDQGVLLWNIQSGTVNFTDPAAAALLAQYATWQQQNSLFTSRPGEAFAEREELVQNGRAAMWTVRADRRPAAGGEPAPLVALPLPQLNSPILRPPWQTVLFISRGTAHPDACMAWLDFLTTRADAVTAVPARQSVANGRIWQNQVGADNAAILREALARHLAAAQPPVEIVTYRITGPLYYWLQEAADAAAAGGDIPALLAAAQTKAENYLACLPAGGAPDHDQAVACAAQADPAFEEEP